MNKVVNYILALSLNQNLSLSQALQYQGFFTCLPNIFVALDIYVLLALYFAVIWLIWTSLEPFRTRWRSSTNLSFWICQTTSECLS